MSSRPHREEETTKPVGNVLRKNVREAIQEMLNASRPKPLSVRMAEVRRYLTSRSAPLRGISEETVSGKKFIAVHCPDVTYFFVP